jgi:DeoR/GlpR family transcriptional regulator of sugar metabolism
MIKAAHRVVVVAEGPKLGRISVARFAGLDEVDLLVTGPSAPSELVSQIRERGVATTVTQ